MTQPKTTLLALILPFLAINLTAMGMDNPKFNELILRPFKHEQIKPTIELLDNACTIGYGDQDCHRDINEAGFKTELNSPLIPFKVTIKQNIKKIVIEQMVQEREEFNKILQDEIKNIETSTPAENRSTKKFKDKMFIHVASRHSIFNKRTNLLMKSANSLGETPNLPWPNLIPVDCLDDSNIKINLYNSKSIDLEFNDCQKIETLKKAFTEKPTLLFCNLPQAAANRFNNPEEELSEHENDLTYSEDDFTSSEDEDDIIAGEIAKIIAHNKNHLISNKIINRREPQYDDMQIFSSTTLPKSNIISIEASYYSHGENGYSAEKSRKKLLEEKLGGQNPVTFSNKRQKTGHKTHQTVQQITHENNRKNQIEEKLSPIHIVINNHD